MILGMPSIAELIDLVATKDYDVAQIGSSATAFAPQWQRLDAAGAADWASDWDAFQTRYAVAHGIAQAEIALAKLTLVPNADIPAGPGYSELLIALSPHADGQVQKGDLQDLAARLDAARARAGLPPTDFSRQPQPAGLDTDLEAYQAADGAIKAGEGAIRSSVPTALILGGGLLLLVLLVRK